jgi:hypothetical protein
MLAKKSVLCRIQRLRSQAAVEDAYWSETGVGELRLNCYYVGEGAGAIHDNFSSQGLGVVQISGGEA